MKGTVVLVIVLAVALIGIAFYVVTEAGGSKWVEDGWNDTTDSSGASSSGDWGTEVEVEYADGTTENLNSINPLKITYGDKEVANFVYRLFAKGSSNELTKCSLDLTGFWVECIATQDNLTKWTGIVEYGIIGDLDLDGGWHEIYEIKISNDSFSDTADGEYTLEFLPAGSIYYRGAENSNWVEIKDIPSDCWLIFTVDNFSIGVEFESGIRYNYKN